MISSKHPLNLTLRFLLEISALIIAGYWAYYSESSSLKYLFMIGLPIIMASIWGIFAVPNDPSRSGKTVFKTPGILRLIIEILFFGFSAYLLYSMEYKFESIGFTIMVLIQYLLSLDRIKWLLKH
jgi:uncharacterized membrane protein HdeD (DUF308 family)